MTRVQIHTYSSSRTPKDPAARHVEDLKTAQERWELKARETWFEQEHAETKHFLVMAAAATLVVWCASWETEANSGLRGSDPAREQGMGCKWMWG